MEKIITAVILTGLALLLIHTMMVVVIWLIPLALAGAIFMAILSIITMLEKIKKGL